MCVFHMTAVLSRVTVITWGLALLYFVPFPNILPNKACRNLIRKATFIFGSGDEQLLSLTSLSHFLKVH